VSSAATRLRDITDEFERALRVIADPEQGVDHFWERPGGLELEQACFDPVREEFVVSFKAGARFRMPLARLHESGGVVVVELDEYRHGVLVVFSDGRTTSFASDLVLYECEPEYRAGVKGARVEHPVGATIRALRLAAGRSAAEVAAAAGMAAPNYARLEASRHRPRVDTLVRIAEALRVPLARLFQAT
jgi:DNA-binding XRE family transcriptional regulator